MSNKVKVLVIIILVISLGLIYYFKDNEGVTKDIQNVSQNSIQNNEYKSESKKKLPILIELSIDGCPPCKSMEPIIKNIEEEFREKLVVKRINITKNPSEAKIYKTSLYPTQILFDAQGKEVLRHEGFLSKEDIVTAINKIGVK